MQDVETWTYWNKFLGYSGRDPRFVFVGLEERAHPNLEDQDVQRRCEHKEVFDSDRANKDDALEILYPKSLHSVRPETVPQWVTAAAIVSRVKVRLNEVDGGHGDLGTSKGDSFLAELLPIPRKSSRRRHCGEKSYPLRRFGSREERRVRQPEYRARVT